ncbi:hypothetical protein [Methyloceanibacter caenitepidi]|uniref:hypothetical protein n=1 Tax=Methyloceanibacter caenitepidi TaxID=1384459 RepID=UPI0005EF6A33|nr:hypothetical protein [Methyloceanibacter caenitepidi]
MPSVDGLRRCLVLGSAQCLWDDIEAALQVGEYDAVIAAKQAGIVWPGELYAWVTLHPEWMDDYRAERSAHGYPVAQRIVAHEKGKGVDVVVAHRWPGASRCPSSGGVAVKYALEDGFGKIVMCGIPMDMRMGRIDGREGWPSAQRYLRRFEEALPYMQDKVRSMSGRTKDLLGPPTPEWLLGQ